jgi:hypothetical protein
MENSGADMFDDLATHFYEHVVRSLEDYLSVKNSGVAGRSRDIHTAINAATPLYHLREHLPSPFELKWETVNSRCPDYSLLGDIVNASKHSTLTRENPQIANATQIFELLVNTEYKDKQGPFFSVEKLVMVKLANGMEKDVLEVLVNVMNFWQDYLHSIGSIQRSLKYTVPVVAQPRLRADCDLAHMDFEAVQGLQFKQIHRLQIFNYATGKVELRDMTGKHIRFTVSKPAEPAVLDLTLQNEPLGKQFKRKITLSAKESAELARLQDSQDKQAYLENLPSAQKALHEMTLEAGISQKPHDAKEQSVTESAGE